MQLNLQKNIYLATSEIVSIEHGAGALRDIHSLQGTVLLAKPALCTVLVAGVTRLINKNTVMASSTAVVSVNVGERDCLVCDHSRDANMASNAW